MSVRQSELAWELDLSSNRKFILLELADHADPDGRHVFPSQEFIARRTGYSVRQIRRILHELEDLGLIEPVAYRKGGRGMATEYDLHLDPSTNEKAVKMSAFSAVKADICDQKADTGVRPIVKNRNRTVKETLGAEIEISTSQDPPDWFNVLSSLERFDQSFEICQDWVGKHGVPEVLAQRLAYSLKDWLSRQSAGSKALRGDPWTRFTAWVVRDLNEATPDAGGTDKYLVAQEDAKRRGK